MERRKSVTSTSQNIHTHNDNTERKICTPMPSPYIFRILRITYTIGRHLVLTSLHITSFTMTFLECLSQTKYKNTLMYWSDFWLGQIMMAFGNLKGYRKLVPKYPPIYCDSSIHSLKCFPWSDYQIWVQN